MSLWITYPQHVESALLRVPYRLWCCRKDSRGGDLRLRRGAAPAKSLPTVDTGIETRMADHGAPMDMPAHERTYGAFINLFKYGAIACFLIAFLVIFIITR